MRIVLVAISLTLLSVLNGCVTYEPVAAMPDWKLQSEYDELQIKQIQLEREMLYGERIHTTRTSGDSNNTRTRGGFFGGMADSMQNTSTTTVSNPAISELNATEDRMREIQSEILRRQQMGYQTATPQHSSTTNSWNGPVYTTQYSCTFHRSECSKLRSQEGDLMKFSSSEKARKNGGKPCPDCNP